MVHPEHILIVDDEDSVRSLLERLIQQEGYSVQCSSTGEGALAAIQQRIPDLVILDYDLPGLNGKDICKRIRRDPATRPISVLMITGRTIEGLPADCLNSGADDYMPKPFDIKELAARINAILRRPKIFADKIDTIQRGLLTIRPDERTVTIQGKELTRLTPKEYELLYQIALYSPRILDKNTLALKVWGQTIDSIPSRTLDVHIRRIRSKLGPASKFLITIPSVGFQWLDQPQNLTTNSEQA